MNFVDLKYYSSLCEQQFKQINANSPYGPHKEVLERNYVSRLYYTTFLHCANTLDLLDSEKGEDSHNETIKKVAQPYYGYLVYLKSLRRHADYNMDPFSLPYRFKSTKYGLKRLRAVLDEIPEQDKSSLSK